MVFMERKPLLRLSVTFFNVLTSLFALIMIAKAWLLKTVTWQEAGMVLFCLLWLFGRKPFTQMMLIRKMRNQTRHNNPLELSISKNGIVWTGKGIRQGSVSWQHIKKIYVLRNGYIVPCHLAKFLWIPLKEFHSKEDRKLFENYCAELNIKLKKLKVSC